jgi:hypothetical protein
MFQGAGIIAKKRALYKRAPRSIGGAEVERV